MLAGLARREMLGQRRRRDLERGQLRDEALDYAVRLLRAGTATELHVFAGTCHGFDSLLPDWEVSEQLFVLQGRALRRAFYGA